MTRSTEHRGDFRFVAREHDASRMTTGQVRGILEERREAFGIGHEANPVTDRAARSASGDAHVLRSDRIVAEVARKDPVRLKGPFNGRELTHVNGRRLGAR